MRLKEADSLILQPRYIVRSAKFAGGKFSDAGLSGSYRFPLGP